MSACPYFAGLFCGSRGVWTAGFGFGGACAAGAWIVVGSVYRTAGGAAAAGAAWYAGTAAAGATVAFTRSAAVTGTAPAGGLVGLSGRTTARTGGWSNRRGRRCS